MSRVLNLDLLKSNDDFITTDMFLRNSAELGYNYLKRDFLLKSGSWRGAHISSIFAASSKFKGKSLVVGHSDLETSSRTIHFLKLFGISQVFGTNVYPISNFSSSIPLGLTNDCDDSPMHRLFGNTDHLIRANQSALFLPDYDGSIYVNFTSTNNTSIRKLVLKILSDVKGAVYEGTDFSEKGRIRYLSGLRSNSYVACPEGNGIDTHRLWETLYMGGVPIVRKSAYLSSLLEGLPVLVVDDWRQIADADFLETRWYDLKNASHNLDKLKMSYWLNLLDKSH